MLIGVSRFNILVSCFIILLALLGIALNGCSSGSGGSPAVQPGEALPTEQPATALPGFPAPSTLSRTASVPTETDLIREADLFYPLIARNNVSESMGYAEFSPQWDPTAAIGPDQLAYAGYTFHNLLDYTGDAGISLVWDTQPTDISNLYIGMGNHVTDTWQWFNGADNGFTEMGDLANFINSSGEMYLIVLLLGTDVCQLDKLFVGERMSIHPSLVSDLNPDPSLNIAPQTVSFDANGSMLYGGTIESFDFDYDDDGTFDVTGNTDGLCSHDYTDPGSHTCRVRVYDDIGRHEETALEFWLVDPDNDPPIAVLIVDPQVGPAPLEVTLDASQSYDGTGIIKYEWDLDADGIYELDSGTDATLQILQCISNRTYSVRVTDTDYAQAADDAFCILLGGFSSSTVATDQAVNGEMSMVISDIDSNPRPCVAWQDGNGKDLWFALAEENILYYFCEPVNPVPTAGDTGYSPVMMTNSTGHPIIAFGTRDEGGEYDLQTVHATDAECTTWDGPHDVNLGDHVGGSNAIYPVNNVPAIASIARYGEQDQSSIRFYLSQDGNGTAWNPGEELLPAQPGVQIVDVSLYQSVEGMIYNPIAAFVYGGAHLHTSGFGTVLSTAADGSAWGTPTSFNGYSMDSVHLGIADGNPALVSGSGTSGGTLEFVRADNSAGSSWTATPRMLAEGGYSGSCCMRRLDDGRPAVCYISPDGSDLWYITAIDAAGTGWNDPYRAADYGKVYRYCSMVIIKGDDPLICYYDETDNKVRCALWQD